MIQNIDLKAYYCILYIIEVCPLGLSSLTGSRLYLYTGFNAQAACCIVIVYDSTVLRLYSQDLLHLWHHSKCKDVNEPVKYQLNEDSLLFSGMP